MLALPSLEIAKVTRAKCLVKMQKALNLWVEDRNRKCVLRDGNMLCPKAVSLCEGFSKGPPEKEWHRAIYSE